MFNTKMFKTEALDGSNGYTSIFLGNKKEVSEGKSLKINRM